MPPSKIRKAIWEVDDDLLDVDQLSMVSRMLPTHDEVIPHPLTSDLCALALTHVDRSRSSNDSKVIAAN